MSNDWIRIHAPEGPFLQRFPADAPRSMIFTVIREEWDDDPGPSEHNPEGLPERTIIEYEVRD